MGNKGSHRLLSPSVPGKLGVASLSRSRKGYLLWADSKSCYLPHTATLDSTSMAHGREDYPRAPRKIMADIASRVGLSQIRAGIGKVIHSTPTLKII